MKLKGLLHPSHLKLWWLIVSQVLTGVNSATKLTVVILNTYTRFSTSLSTSADVCNGLVY